MNAFKWFLAVILLAVIGAGAYWYCNGILPTYGSGGKFEMTVDLLDPKTNKPMVDTPFYLVLIKDGETDPMFKRPLFGTTNSTGQAAKIISKTELSAKDYVLVQKVGEGEYGKYFALLGEGNAIPLPNTDYAITGCGDTPEYKGTSNRQGYTVFYATNQACKIKMSINWGSTLDNLLH